METLPTMEQSPQNPSPANAVNPKSSKVKFGATYIFRLRKQIEGPFPNLWELSMLDPKSCEKSIVKKLISDADALIYCLDNLQGELEADGL